MTVAESDAQTALELLDDEYRRRREALQADAEAARAAADPVRDGLLYGTAKPLERVVAAVLTEAGITVTELDRLLGDSSSADLLAELDGRRRLIEVKSASGNAPESLMGRLENHLRNWPPPGHPPIEGGALIVNHQHRRPPAQRSAAVYERAEFLRNLPAPVISTRELFESWRSASWDQLRARIFPTADSSPSITQMPHSTESRAPRLDAREITRRRWRRRGAG